MTDCLYWFIAKHYIIASIMFPEISFVWAVWMEHYWWATIVLLFIASKWSVKTLSYFVKQ